jgi:3-oxoadipate enol-lactonase
VAQFLTSQRPPGLVKFALVAVRASNATKHFGICKAGAAPRLDGRENALQALAFLTAYPPSDALWGQILADNFAASSSLAKLAWPTSSAYEDISAVVGKIAVPTLILAGDHDRQDPGFPPYGDQAYALAYARELRSPGPKKKYRVEVFWIVASRTVEPALPP